MASASSPARVKLPAVPKPSCSSSESRELLQLVPRAGGWERGPCSVRAESTVEGLAPLRGDEKHIAGVKDLPGGLSTAVWEVHQWEGL